MAGCKSRGQMTEYRRQIVDQHGRRCLSEAFFDHGDGSSDFCSLTSVICPLFSVIGTMTPIGTNQPG